MANKKTTPLKIIIKGIDVEISAEQAIRTGILRNLFEARKIYAPGFKFGEEPEDEFDSDIDKITIRIPSIEILGEGGNND